MARKGRKLEVPLQTTAGPPTKNAKLSLLVARNVREKIASGELQIGSNLPLEPELLGIFNVSRPTLREALRILESEELISINSGDRSGAVIVEPSLHKAAEYSAILLSLAGVNIRNLQEARTMLEPAAIMTLSSAEAQTVAPELSACILKLESLLIDDNLAEFVQKSNDFHKILMGSAKNLVIIFFSELIMKISSDAFPREFSGYSDHEDLERNLSYTLMAYKKLVKSLAVGDVSDAAAIWRKHMESGLKYLENRELGDQRIWRLCKDDNPL